MNCARDFRRSWFSHPNDGSSIPAKCAEKSVQGCASALTGSEDVLFYDVGLWLPTHHFVVNAAQEMRTPLVISPRGVLSDEALTELLVLGTAYLFAGNLFSSWLRGNNS